MTVIYMDENIHLTAPQNRNHLMDMERWMPGLEAGDLLDSPLNPVIYSVSDALQSRPEQA